MEKGTDPRVDCYHRVHTGIFFSVSVSRTRSRRQQRFRSTSAQQELKANRVSLLSCTSEERLERAGIANDDGDGAFRVAEQIGRGRVTSSNCNDPSKKGSQRKARAFSESSYQTARSRVFSLLKREQCKSGLTCSVSPSTLHEVLPSWQHWQREPWNSICFFVPMREGSRFTVRGLIDQIRRGPLLQE